MSKFQATIFILVSIFVFGSCMGSFLNVMISRLPFDSFFKTTRSHCPNCGVLIPAYFNIPIVSYLFLRGKAQCCGAKISLRYLIIEVLGGLLAVFVYIRFPFLTFESSRPLLIDNGEMLRAAHALVFVYLGLVCAVVDLEHMIIPDWVSLPMIGFTPMVVYFHPELNAYSAGMGVLLGGGILYLVSWLYYLLRGEIGLGMGDVKLVAAIGGWLGYQAVFPTLFLGSILGSIFGLTLMLYRRTTNLRTAIPFGPFLVFASWLYFFYGHQLVEIIFNRS